jgi:hypothetical protein
VRGEPWVPLPLRGKEKKFKVKVRVIIRKVRIKVEEEEKVTIFGRIFPFTKADEKERVNGDEVIFFISSPEFTPNMANEFEVIVSFNLTHTIAKKFGDSGINFELIGRLGNFTRNTRINQLPSLRLMSTSTSSILNHFLSLRII